VQRARIVLPASEGITHPEIAARCGVTRQTGVTRRARYPSKGLAGLEDAERAGRPRRVDQVWLIAEALQVWLIAEALRPPPKRLGVSQWSSRLLGDRLQVANSSVTRAWSGRGRPRRP
jgi:hypothetical protein